MTRWYRSTMTCWAAVVVLGLIWSLPVTAQQANMPTGRAASGRIVNGTPVEREKGPQFPWQVSLSSPLFGGHFCGGSLIADNENASWVLTAAHCTVIIPSPSQLQVISGTLKLDDPDRLTQNVVKIISHALYNGSTLLNDIALLKLEPLSAEQRSSERAQSSWRQAVKLPDPLEAEDLNSPYVRASVSGWGAISEGGPSPNNLLYVGVPIVDLNACRKSYNTLGYTIYNSMMCGGFRSGRYDSCQGDSGGPFVTLSNRTGAPNLIGVVSWGHGCARYLYYGVYTRVSSFLNWIETQMNTN